MRDSGDLLEHHLVHAEAGDHDDRTRCEGVGEYLLIDQPELGLEAGKTGKLLRRAGKGRVEAQ